VVDAQETSGSADGRDVFTPPALLPIIWADPEHLPEHLALFAVKHFGHRAERDLEKRRASNPDASDAELTAGVVTRGVRTTVTEGAVMGGPITLLVPVAFVAAALAQAQMVLEIAGINGASPTDRLRAADLLVIQTAYRSTEEADDALAAVKTDTHDRGGKRFRRLRLDMVKRMAFLLGVIEPSGGKKRSRLLQFLLWGGIALFVVVAFLLPLLWIPAMAAMFQKGTRRLASRANDFYLHPRTGSEEVEVRAGEAIRIRPVRFVFYLRTLLVALLPLIAALALLLAGIRLIRDHWASAGIVLISVSALSTVGWLAYRAWRRRRSMEDSL
jgi:hypothetical protein